MDRDVFYVFGNWKSHKTILQAVSWFKEFESYWRKNPILTSTLKIVLCPADIHLSTLNSLIQLSGLPLQLGLQNISGYGKGAYTGQVCGEMVKDIVSYSLVGHSERRKYCRETEVELEEKAKQARLSGIEPVYCVQNEHMQIPDSVDLIAYEPVWAIGTGKPDTPENANRVAKTIRERVKQEATIIYGGSVTHDNVIYYVKQEYLSGVLPGGASLEAKAFYQLILNASTAELQT